MVALTKGTRTLEDSRGEGGGEGRLAEQLRESNQLLYADEIK